MATTDVADSDSRVKPINHVASTKRWGRVVVCAAFCTFLLEMGAIQTFGVYLPVLLLEFESGSGELGWIVGSANAITSLTGLFGSVVVNRLGCRRTVMLGGLVMVIGVALSSMAISTIHLFVTLGLTVGLGATMVHVGLVVVVGKFYTKHHAIANGIAFGGIGAGIFVFPPLLQYLIDTYGWRGSLLIQSAIISHIILMGSLFRPASRYKTFKSSSMIRSDSNRHECKTEENDMEPNELEAMATSTDDVNIELNELKAMETPCDDVNSELNELEGMASNDVSKEQGTTKSRCFIFTTYELLKSNPSLILLNISFFVLDAGYSAFIYHLTNWAVISGMTNAQASSLLSSFGIGSLVGRLVHGFFLLQRKYVTPWVLFILLLLVSALAASLTAAQIAFGWTLACVAVFGAASGTLFPLVAVIIREIAGICQLPLAYGLTLFCSGSGSLVGSYLIGIIKDATGSYSLPFYLIGIMFAGAAAIMTSRPLAHWYSRRRAQVAHHMN